MSNRNCAPMNPDHLTSDEFGENSLLSRLNRRFSDLLPSMLRLPPSWEDDPTGHFKRHLAMINLRALSVLVIGGIALALILMILAIKNDSSDLFFTGVAVLPGVFLVQYVLSLFCSANLNLAFSSRVHLVSRLAPDVITVASFLGVVAIGISGIYSAIQAFDNSLQMGLIMTVAAICTIVLFGLNAWVAANSEKLLDLSIRADERQGPADYLFSIVLYLGRYQLILVSYFFLATVLVATFAVGYFGISILVEKNMFSGNLDVIVGMLGFGFLGLTQLLWSFLAPISAHFIYLVFVSIADIGVAFFRLVKGTEKIAQLSEEAMGEDPNEAEARGDTR